MGGQILAPDNAASGVIAFSMLETRKPPESAGLTTSPWSGCSASHEGARHPTVPPLPSVPAAAGPVVATAMSSPAMGPILPHP